MQTVLFSVFTMAVLLLAGGYHTFVSALVSIMLTGFLVLQAVRTRQLKIRASLLSLAFLVLSLMHFLVYFWAIDPSMALKGGVKFLPVILIWLMLAQLDEQQKERWLNLFPVYGTIITLFSLLLSLFPAGRELVTIEGRLGGTFQYPNSFAVFLLACAVISAFQGYQIYCRAREGIADFLACLFQITVCVAGIALSGSRTVYLLTLATVLIILAYLVVGKWDASAGQTDLAQDITSGHNMDRAQEKLPTTDQLHESAQKSRLQSKKPLILAAAVGITAILVLVLALTGAGSLVMERMAAISTRSSTLLGRILYAKDAFAILADHPFGLGFYGYRFLQGMYQTGNYAVVNAHNELLQIMLDLGFLPWLLLVTAGVFSFIREPYQLRNRFVLFVLIAHSLMDYDFHFLGIWILFLLLLPSNANRFIRFGCSRKEAGDQGQREKTEKIKKIKNRQTDPETIRTFRRPAVPSAFVLGALVCVTAYASVRIGMSDLYYISGQNSDSQKWYPNTVTALNLLAESWHTDKERKQLADQILTRDQYVSAAYAVKAQQALESGDAVQMAVYQKAAIRTNPYRFGLYTDYLEMLLGSARIYEQNGDRKSAHACGALAAEIPQMLEEVKNRTGSLGWKLSVRPTVQLDENYQKMLDELLQY